MSLNLYHLLLLNTTLSAFFETCRDLCAGHQSSSSTPHYFEMEPNLANLAALEGLVQQQIFTHMTAPTIAAMRATSSTFQ